jgi:hypothetical protein
MKHYKQQASKQWVKYGVHQEKNRAALVKKEALI